MDGGEDEADDEEDEGDGLGGLVVVEGRVDVVVPLRIRPARGPVEEGEEEVGEEVGEGHPPVFEVVGHVREGQVRQDDEGVDGVAVHVHQGGAPDGGEEDGPEEEGDGEGRHGWGDWGGLGVVG